MSTQVLCALHALWLSSRCSCGSGAAAAAAAAAAATEASAAAAAVAAATAAASGLSVSKFSKDKLRSDVLRWKDFSTSHSGHAP